MWCSEVQSGTGLSVVCYGAVRFSAVQSGAAWRFVVRCTCGEVRGEIRCMQGGTEYCGSGVECTI